MEYLFELPMSTGNVGEKFFDIMKRTNFVVIHKTLPVTSTQNDFHYSINENAKREKEEGGLGSKKSNCRGKGEKKRG